MHAILPLNAAMVTSYLSVWLYSSIRISAFFLIAPLFNQELIPSAVKIILAFAISMMLVPYISHSLSLNISIATDRGMLIILNQVIIGVAMGFIFKMTFEILTMAGQMIAIAMQLNLGEIYDPINHSNTNLIGMTYQIFGMLIFIVIGGPLILIGILDKSFLVMPIDGNFIAVGQIHEILKFSSFIFLDSLLLALPVIITLLIVSVGEMIIVRISTSFNIFTVGFFLSISIGLIVLIYCLPPSLKFFQQVIEKTFAFALHWELIK